MHSVGPVQVGQAEAIREWVEDRVISTQHDLRSGSGMDPVVEAWFKVQIEAYQQIKLLLNGLTTRVRNADSWAQLEQTVVEYLTPLEREIERLTVRQHSLRIDLSPFEDSWRNPDAYLTEELRLYQHARKKLLTLVQWSETSWLRRYALLPVRW